MSDAVDIPDLVRLAAQATAATPIELATGRSGTETDLMVFVRQDDQSVELVDLTPFAARPLRAIGRTSFTEHESLCEYVLRYVDKSATTLWGDKRRGVVVVVLDDHESQVPEGDKTPAIPGQPGWGEHRAVLTLTKTKDWELWTKNDGVWKSQEAFAEFLEDAAQAVVNPDPATMYEMASSFRAKKDVEYKSAVNQANGEVHFVYEETIASKAGQKGQLDIPKSFSIELAPFEGGPMAYPMEARFLYRIGAQGQLSMSYRLIRPDEVLDIAWGDITAQIQSAVGLPVFAGSPR